MQQARIALGWLVAASLVVGMAAPASAEVDLKTYPGAMCAIAAVAGTGSSDLLYNDEGTAPRGAAVNYSTTARDYICPVTADCLATSSTGHWVWVVDNTNDDHVWCNVNVRDADTGSGSWGTSDETTDAFYSSSSTMLEPSATTTSYTYAYKFLTCHVPRCDSADCATMRSAVVAYAVQDNC